MDSINLLYLKLIVALSIHLMNTATPTVYYANIGESVSLQCLTGGGPYACFSTYTFQNSPHPMVMLNSSRKYQVSSGMISINNVQATDAGFYACSGNCAQMMSDQISYFLQPMSMGQPVDITRNWIAIPPISELPNGGGGNDMYYVVVTDERNNNAAGGSVLSDGEIAALVIGLFLALALTVAVITFLIIMNKRRKQKREKILEPGKRGSDKDATSVDYSTIERDYSGGSSKENTLNKQNVDRDGERKSFANNRGIDNLVPDINTKNIKGPNTYKPGDLSLINQQDLPNIDINARNNNANNKKTDSQRSQQSNGGMGGVDAPFDNQVRRPSRQDSDGPFANKNILLDSANMLPPPPAKGPVNRVQFPSRLTQQQQQPPQQGGSNRYVSNENLHLQQIIKESGFMSDMLDSRFDSDEDLDRKQGGSGKPGGFFNPRNLDNYPFENNQQQPQYEPEQDRSNNPSFKSQLRNPKLQQQESTESNDNGVGGVTVVSARAPVRSENQPQQLTILPPSSNRPYQQQQPTKYSFQQTQNNKPTPPHLSFSQRIETTSTPFQLPPPSASVRGGGHGRSTMHDSGILKDGATDV